jgi:hypothetical protein
MKAYAQCYGDFTIVDGTHNTVMYDLKLMPHTNVDSLGKNCFLVSVWMNLKTGTVYLMD